jgi:PAS domain-containing protein
VCKDGSRFWAEVVITALRDSEGTLKGFAKVTRDMTARHAERERSSSSPRRSTTRHQASRSSTAAAATSAQRGLLALLGYTEAELRGRPCSTSPTPTTSASRRLLEEALRAGTRRLELEKRYVRKDGAVIRRTSVAPIVDRGNRDALRGAGGRRHRGAAPSRRG